MFFAYKKIKSGSDFIQKVTHLCWTMCVVIVGKRASVSAHRGIHETAQISHTSAFFRTTKRTHELVFSLYSMYPVLFCCVIVVPFLKVWPGKCLCNGVLTSTKGKPCAHLAPDGTCISGRRNGVLNFSGPYIFEMMLKL